MKLTKEEKFIFELGKRFQDKECAINELAKLCSIGPQSIKNIVKRLKRGNFIKVLDRERVYLTEHGTNFYQMLCEEREKHS